MLKQSTCPSCGKVELDLAGSRNPEPGRMRLRSLGVPGSAVDCHIFLEPWFRGESRLKCLPASGAFEQRHMPDGLRVIVECVAYKAGHAMFNDFRDGAAPQSDDRYCRRYYFDDGPRPNGSEAARKASSIGISQ